MACTFFQMYEIVPYLESLNLIGDEGFRGWAKELSSTSNQRSGWIGEGGLDDDIDPPSQLVLHRSLPPVPEIWIPTNSREDEVMQRPGAALSFQRGTSSSERQSLAARLHNRYEIWKPSISPEGEPNKPISSSSAESPRSLYDRLASPPVTQSPSTDRQDMHLRFHQPTISSAVVQSSPAYKLRSAKRRGSHLTDSPTDPSRELRPSLGSGSPSVAESITHEASDLQGDVIRKGGEEACAGRGLGREDLREQDLERAVDRPAVDILKTVDQSVGEIHKFMGEGQKLGKSEDVDATVEQEQ